MTVEDKITVTVKLFASLQKFGANKSKVTIARGSKVKDILNKFDIPYEEINLIIMINGKPHQTGKTTIQNGDIISLFPPLGGG
ncbi:MAG: MoaD/ThiS family protein [Promethearchaeia archaeon]